MRVIGNLSGGTGSWAACKLAAQECGTDRLTLLFADTLIEDADLYRFLLESAADVLGVAPPGLLAKRAANLAPASREYMAERKDALRAIRRDAAAHFGGRLVWLADGRTPWEVFRDERFLGNSRADPCSKILKRRLLDCWVTENCDPPTTLSVVGLGWWERHRFEGRPGKPGLRQRMAERGWTFAAPLIDRRPTLDRHDILAWLDREGIDPPALTLEGFAHNNCGGGCVKAGQGHWLKLLTARPETFAAWEREEKDLRDLLGDVAMMAEARGGKKMPLPLAEFRRRVESKEELSLVGGAPCGCFAGDDEAD